MKLYRAGFGEHWHYVGANCDVEAIVRVKTLDTCFTYLPVTATEIVEEFGNEIVVNEIYNKYESEPIPEFIQELREETKEVIVEVEKPVKATKKR